MFQLDIVGFISTNVTAAKYLALLQILRRMWTNQSSADIQLGHSLLPKGHLMGKIVQTHMTDIREDQCHLTEDKEGQGHWKRCITNLG